jgi:hypothetical protein
MLPMLGAHAQTQTVNKWALTQIYSNQTQRFATESADSTWLQKKASTKDKRKLKNVFIL